MYLYYLLDKISNTNPYLKYRYLINIMNYLCNIKVYILYSEILSIFLKSNQYYNFSNDQDYLDNPIYN